MQENGSGTRPRTTETAQQKYPELQKLPVGPCSLQLVPLDLGLALGFVGLGLSGGRVESLGFGVQGTV